MLPREGPYIKAEDAAEKLLSTEFVAELSDCEGNRDGDGQPSWRLIIPVEAIRPSACFDIGSENSLRFEWRSNGAN